MMSNGDQIKFLQSQTKNNLANVLVPLLGEHVASDALETIIREYRLIKLSRRMAAQQASPNAYRGILIKREMLKLKKEGVLY